MDFYLKIFIWAEDVHNLEYSLRLMAGSAWCLTLLTGRSDWAQEAKGLSSRIKGLEARVEALPLAELADSEYQQERSWLSEKEIVEAIDYRRQVTRISNQHKVTFKEALNNMLGLTLDQMVAINERLKRREICRG